MRKNKAFTLAEVLLVLAIIGVIAAITIPATMQQSAEKKYAALAQKAFSTIQNAVDLKMTYVPTRPRNHGNNLFMWLSDGAQYGHDTIKIVKSSPDMKTIQTPDGIIYEVQYESNDTSGTLGRKYGLRIDLNGSEPPTKSVATKNKGISNSGYVNNAKNFDVIYIVLTTRGTLEMEPGSDPENDRARKYMNLPK